MNKYIFVKFNNSNENEVLKKLHNNNINVYKITDGTYKINKKDLSKISKIFLKSEFKIIKQSGISHIKGKIVRHNYEIIAFIVFLCGIILSSYLIVDIQIKHLNSDIKRQIIDTLEKNNIRRFTFRKSFQELEKVKKKILAEHTETIEWVEIKRKGMIYIINVEERKHNVGGNTEKYCNMYAKKDGMIENIEVYKGESVIEKNEYIKKGSLLISGDINYNNESVNKVCADGKVLANIWYTVKIKVPLREHKKILKKKKRYNFEIEYNNQKHQILKNRLKTYERKRKKIFDLMHLKIFLLLDTEAEDSIIRITPAKAEQKALDAAEEKIKLKLKEDEYIKSKKILQKNYNNSIMNIEVFVVTLENIGVTREEKG